jgi:hypothetical protein
MENQDNILNNENLKATIDVEEQKIISLNKFIFLSIISFGAYGLWWIYKAWSFHKQKNKIDIWPASRAILSFFFLESLFRKILSFSKEKGYSKNYSSTLLFIGYFVANFLSYLPDPFWLISIFSFLFLIPPFEALNYAKQNSNDFITTEQNSFSERQIWLIVGGIIFWIFVLLVIVIGDV